MKYITTEALQVLQQTPLVLRTLFTGISEGWVMGSEGPETFSPYDVLGHLIHGEKTDWVARAKIILEFGVQKPFTPWDRYAQYEESKGKTLQQLLDEFELIRKKNMRWLKAVNLTEADLDKKGMHPKLGEITLKNLLATWVVHDLTHIAQITRVMAKQYKEEMGPWPEFFRILSF